VTGIVDICWALVAAVWVLGAAYNSRRAPAVQRQASRRPSIVGGLVAGWFVTRIVPVSEWSSLRVTGWWVRVVGLAVLLSSTAFTLWARAALGTMWSASPSAKQDHELRTDGPYRITRHPIYTGLLGMLAGTALAVGLGRWTLLVALGVVLVEVKIHAEERLLTELFPVEYEQYRRHVPQLVPLARWRHRALR